MIGGRRVAHALRAMLAGSLALAALIVFAAPLPAQEEPRDTGSESEKVDFDKLVPLLEQSPHTLRDIVRQTDQPPTRPISARFFLVDGQLTISVITAERGYYLTADENILTERVGPASDNPWNPRRRELTRVPDVARAAMALTLMQSGELKLMDFIERSEADYPGTVVAVVPESPNLEPSVEVLMLYNGELWELDYGLDGTLEEREKEWP